MKLLYFIMYIILLYLSIFLIISKNYNKVVKIIVFFAAYVV